MSVLTETLSAEPSAAAGCARCCSTPLRRVVAIVVCTGGAAGKSRDAHESMKGIRHLFGV